MKDFALSSVFVSGSIHDINNMLMISSMRLELLQEKIQEEHAESISKIKESLSRAGEVSKKYFEIIKGELRKDIVEFENFVNETVKYTLDQYENIEFTIKGEEQYISINQISIQMVLVNILKNAVESFDNNMGKIKVEIKPDGKNIQLIIKDNGSGIKKELFEKIMEPTYTTKETGTGLGLFECKIIIEKHNGEFYFESEIGIGSTFYVVLPRK